MDKCTEHPPLSRLQITQYYGVLSHHSTQITPDFAVPSDLSCQVSPVPGHQVHLIKRFLQLLHSSHSLLSVGWIDTCDWGLIVTCQVSDNQRSQTRLLAVATFSKGFLLNSQSNYFSSCLEIRPQIETQVLCHTPLPALPFFLLYIKIILSNHGAFQHALPPYAQHAACTAPLQRLCMMAHSSRNKTLTSSVPTA